MTRIRLSADHIRSISLINGITGAQVKDLVEEGDRLIIIVAENEISKAIGRRGDNVRKLEKSLNRKIKIVEFNPKVVAFIKNLIYPLKAQDIQEDGGIITITPVDLKTRGYLIGRNAQTLRQNERIVKRYFQINEIKISKCE